MSDTIEELPIIFSESAALKVKDLIAEENSQSELMLRVFIQEGAALAFNMVLRLMNQKKMVTLWSRKMG